MLEVFRRFGSVQYDPLAVAGRTHDLVLHARVADYEPAWCDHLYERREIFEAYNKGLSLRLDERVPVVPRHLEPDVAAPSLAENAEVAERVLERIRADGPLSALDFERERGEHDRLVRRADERRARRARGVHGHRRARARAARRQPPLLRPPRAAAARRRARARGAAGGAAPAQAPLAVPRARPPRRRRRRRHLRRPRPGEARPAVAGHPGRTALREELVEDGELVPVEVEGVRGKRFVLREEVELLGAPPEPPPSVAFLPPFDPLVWDRGLLGSLFGFEYVWELFLPPAKRRFGWYVLPILFRDRFVGRIEPRIEREDGRVRGDRRLVGGRLRAATRGRLRRRDARGARAPTSASRARAGSSGRRTSVARDASFVSANEGGARARVDVGGRRRGSRRAQCARACDPGRGRRGAPGMSVAAVSAEWGVPLRPNYEVRPTCGTAASSGRGSRGGDLHAARAVRRRLLPERRRHG